ncbi:MAG: YfhO family protein [Candidatus Kapaibacterium sp.]
MASTPKASSSIPEKYHDLLFVALLAVLIIGFLGKAIFGPGFNASDNIASESFQTFLKDASSKGEFPHWLPYIFSGLPSYAALLTTGDRTWDFTAYVVSKISFLFAAVLGSDTARIGFWYILYATGVYFLMRTKGFERPVSFFSAATAVFSTWVITWVMIGHNTKPIAFAMFPYILMCLERLREKWSLSFAVLLTIAVHTMVESTHLQMVFYGICAFGLYLLFELISRLVTKNEPLGVVRAAAVLAVAGALSFGMGADRFLSTLEYTPYSTRGSAPIGQLADQGTQKGANKQDANGGNDYDYATNWSFSPEEMTTFFIPNYYGFGKLTYKGPLTSNKETVIPTYFGQMPFTDAANYMGLAVLFIAVYGAWRNRKDLFALYLITLSLFALLLSFGKNMSILYDLFYYVVPSFNKFRAPSMVLALLQFAVPLLAAYGIRAFSEAREDKDAKAKKAAFIMMAACGVFLALGLVAPSVIETSYREQVEASRAMQSYGPDVKAALSEFVFKEMQSDWRGTGLFALLAGALVWMFVTKRINHTMFYAALTVVCVADLWRVDVRPMDIPKKRIESDVFAKTDLIEFLKSDTTVFRIADMDVLPAPNVAAYHRLENIHGYHSAKMRVYQDLMDEAGNGGGSIINNPLLWNMLNVKYIIAAQDMGVQPVFVSSQNNARVYLNPSFRPRAYFVNHAVVASKMDILRHLKQQDFNDVDTAYVEEALPVAIDTIAPGARVELTRRENERQTYTVDATGNNLVFFSEVYYPVSWKATIDGKEAPIIKTNFAFRGLVVPKGRHTVEFRYESPKFEQGKSISLACNVLVVLAALGAGFLEWRARRTA